MTKKIRVNVTVAANTAAIRRETRNGREVIVVPSATLPDNIIMNRIRYPAEEIAKSFATLNSTPAPLGHPVVNGRYVSARDPEGLNTSYIGAWNENARQENCRVLLDKVIDVKFAQQTEGGKAVLNAIDKGEPIHTSTGLLCTLEPDPNSGDILGNAKDILFDHDAIILNGVGAATPDQGVGMFVNNQEIEVVNSVIDDIERDIDYTGTRLVELMERKRYGSIWQQIKALLPDFKANDTKDVPVSVTKEEFAALAVQVNGLADTLAKLDVSAAVTAAVKPLTDHLAAMQTNAAREAEAAKSALVDKIVAANIMSKDTASALTVNALEELVKLAEPGKAAALNPAFRGNKDADEFADINLNDIYKVN